MTNRRGPIPIIGGPLDGQQYTKTTKRPMYLTDEGDHMPSSAGDRVFNPHRPPRADAKHRSGYILRTTAGGEWSLRYVHSSAGVDE